MRWPVVVALAVALGGAACRSAIPAAVLLPPDDPRPARLLADFTAAADARRGLRGRARLAVDAAEGEVRLRSKQVIALEKPGRLRVEIKALFDQTLAVLVTDAGEFELLRADDQSYQRGSVEPGLLWETALLDLAPSDAIELLLAAPNLEPQARVMAARADANGGVELDLEGEPGSLRQRLHFDADDRLSWLERYDSAGRREWRAEYSDYAAVGDDLFPHSLSIVTAANSHAKLTLSGVELNPELPATLFQLRPR